MISLVAKIIRMERNDADGGRHDVLSRLGMRTGIAYAAPRLLTLRAASGASTMNPGGTGTATH